MNYESKHALKYFNPHGHLTVIYGPMFASKTDYLLMLLGIRMGIKQKILIINSSLDVRLDLHKSDGLTSHRDSPSRIKNSKHVSTDKLSKIDVSSYDVIGIDEAQFFEDITFIFEWLKMGKTIFTAGLMFTSESKPFGDYYVLLSHADEVIPLTAVCVKCMDEGFKHGLSNYTRPANMTKCVMDQKNQDILVGSDQYIPVCRYHYYN